MCKQKTGVNLEPGLLYVLDYTGLAGLSYRTLPIRTPHTQHSLSWQKQNREWGEGSMKSVKSAHKEQLPGEEEKVQEAICQAGLILRAH